MNFTNTSILSSTQFKKDDLEKLFKIIHEIVPVYKGKKESDILKGKILASIFFEPSTRTRFSFETAMLKLGGKVISNTDMMNTSSVKKQETLYDTGKIISKFADIIVMRHPIEGSVKKLSEGSEVPVINAGDGPGDHPTQGLLDIYTIQKQFQKIDGLTIGMVGDLKNSRVQHSECHLLKHFDVNFIFVSPKELSLPKNLKEDLTAHGRKFLETNDLESVIKDFDVLSDSRIQEERFESKEEYKKFKGVYQINKHILSLAKQDMSVLAPLPRVDEIHPEIDDDPRVKYFEQVENGVCVRMGLLALVMGKL